MKIRYFTWGLVTATALVCNSVQVKAYALIDFLLAPQPTPILETVSLPPLVVLDQVKTAITAYTDTEKQLQQMLKDAHKTVDLGIVEFDIGLSPQMKKMGKGLLNTPNAMSKEHLGVSSKKLAQVTQDALTTTAGAIEGISQYVKERAYEEQSRAIEQVATALVIKDNLSKLKEAVDKFNKESTELFAKMEGGEEDYDSALRVNADVRLLYDQLLSLQQQIMAQRNQVKGGKVKETVMPLSQSLVKN